MSHVIAFYFVQIGAAGYAIWRGGAPERWVAALMIVAAGITTTSSYGRIYQYVNRVELAVDLVFLAALLLIAVRAARFWPMYVAALQLIGVAVHGVRAIDPDMLSVVYSRAAAAIAYPMLLLLAVGTSRHVRRLRLAGSRERDWSPFRW